MFTIYKNVIGLSNDTKNIALDVVYSPFWSAWQLFVWILVLFTKIPLWLQILLPILLVRYFVDLVLASYQTYLDLGQEGSSADWWGWWRVQRLMFFGRLPDVFEAPPVPPGLKPYRGKLFGLPERQGDERPTVIGCAPQRQVSQKTSPDVYAQHLVNIQKIADAYPDFLHTDTSFLEPHTTALKAKQSAKTDKTPAIEEFGWEIGHPHESDGSMYVLLHPEDIKTIIEAKWGERHPIANTTWYWLNWFHRPGLAAGGKTRRPPVPEYLCFIYSPRNEEDMATIKRIIAAAASFVTGNESIVFPPDRPATPDPNYEPVVV